MAPRCMVILNPWAGKGTAGAQQPALEAALKAAEIDYVLYTTRARGGATELAWQAIAAGVRHVVAVGGDGTINEVVNGIVGGSAETGQRAALGIIPIGTGSDFIKSIPGFEAGAISQAVGTIAAGRTSPIDLGLVQVEGQEPRYFINGLGMGLDAQIAWEAMQITNLRGIAVYFLAIVRALAKYKAHPMNVEYGGTKLRRRLLFASAANGQFQGGGFRLTPNAQISDGALDICLVENMRLDQIIRYIPRVLEGTHTNLKQVTMSRITDMQVESSAPIPVATDGEVIATDARRVSVRVAPHAFDLLI